MPEVSGLWIVMLFAVIDWMVVFKDLHRIRLITKPLVIIALFIWMTCTAEISGILVLFAAGLIFSLLGDIWLMLPRRFFIAGLFSFMLAHLSYLVGYNLIPGKIQPSFFLVLIGIMVVVVIIVKKILTSLSGAVGTGKLRIPIFIYCFVICAMFVSALSTLFREAWGLSNAITVVIGSSLFFLSDTLLAFDRFVKPIKYGRLLVRITYHLGQIGIILGVLGQFAHQSFFI